MAVLQGTVWLSHGLGVHNMRYKGQPCTQTAPEKVQQVKMHWHWC